MERDTKDDLNLNEILELRRKKLESLREKGKDPFKIDRYDRKHFTRQIKKTYDDFEGKEVSAAGRI